MILSTPLRIRHPLACAGIVFTLLIAGCATTPAPSAKPIGLAPVLDSGFADPFVLPRDDGTLVAYATNRTEADGTRTRTHITMSTSRDARHWTTPTEAMPTLPAWVSRERPDIWAPEAMQIGARYVLFFTGRHATRRRPDGLTLCIGAAVATQPTGPFVAQAEPLTCGGENEYGVIDASPFRDVDAHGRTQLWLVYKTDGNCCEVPTTFVSQRLRDDGLALEGTPQVIAGAVNDQPWEGHVVEAPELLRHDDQLYLFYAGNDYGSGTYATGYARCDSPTGPCRDAPENPILASAEGAPALVGPGHQNVFHFRGRDWIAFHGWRPAANGHPRYRALYVLPLDWSQGRPLIRR